VVDAADQLVIQEQTINFVSESRILLEDMGEYLKMIVNSVARQSDSVKVHIGKIVIPSTALYVQADIQIFRQVIFLH
jgi:hypothetical protein